MSTVVTSKPAYKSLTILFNILAGIVALVGLLTNAHIPILSDLAVSKAAVAVVTAINVILRFRTKEPITATGGDSVVVEDQKNIK